MGEVTEEVGNTLGTGVGSPTEATSRDLSSQNEKVAKLAITSESKRQILLNPDTNVYCPMEVVGGSNISQSQSLHAGVTSSIEESEVQQVCLPDLGIYCPMEVANGNHTSRNLTEKGLSIFWIPRLAVQWKSLAEMEPLSIQFIAWTPVSAVQWKQLASLNI